MKYILKNAKEVVQVKDTEVVIMMQKLQNMDLEETKTVQIRDHLINETFYCKRNEEIDLVIGMMDIEEIIDQVTGMIGPDQEIEGLSIDDLGQEIEVQGQEIQDQETEDPGLEIEDPGLKTEHQKIDGQKIIDPDQKVVNLGQEIEDQKTKTKEIAVDQIQTLKNINARDDLHPPQDHDHLKIILEKDQNQIDAQDQNLKIIQNQIEDQDQIP